MGLINRISSFFKRSHPSNPTEELLYLFGGGHRSYTGKILTEEESLSLSAVLDAVRGLSQIVASLPLFLYKRLERGKEKVTNNPLYTLLHLKPNRLMTSITFRECLMVQALLFGTAFAEKALGPENGQIMSLWPLQSKNMVTKWINGELIYAYKPPDGSTKMFSEDQILRVSGFSDSGILGINVVKKNAEAISLSLALEEFGARFFGNGASPSVVLEHPDQLSDNAYEHLRNSFEKRHRGLSNMHRAAILEEGMKLKEFGNSPEEAQAIESRKFQIDEIARIFNVPVHMLKSLDRTTFNNVEMLSQEFVLYSLIPWLVRFEQAYTTQLLSDKDIKKYFFEHQVSGLLRGDTQARHESYTKGRQWGYYSANDVRELENLNPIEGGDVYLQPLNMVDATKAEDILEAQKKKPEPKGTEVKENGQKRQGHQEEVNGWFNTVDFRNCGCPEHEERSDDGIEPPKYPDNIPEDRRRIMVSFNKVFLSTFERFVDKEARKIESISKSSFTERSETEDFLKSVNKVYDKFPEIVKRDLHPMMEAFAETIFAEAFREMGERKPNPRWFGRDFTDWFDEWVAGFTRQYVDSSIGQITQITQTVAANEINDTVVKRVNEWREKRAIKETRDNIYAIANGSSQRAIFKLNRKAVWKHLGDSCPYCKHLDGRMVAGYGQYFIKRNEEFQPEGAETPLKLKRNVSYPPIHHGCDCIIVAG